MAARKRKDSESFEEYRFNLKNEEFANKVKLSPKIVWNASIKGTVKRILAR